MIPHQPLFTVEETLSLLRIGRTLFYRLIAQGRLSTVKIARKTFVKRDEIERFLATLDREAV